MRRRDVLALLAAAVPRPRVARAQQPALPVIGFVNAASAETFAPQVSAFIGGLRETGYVDGRTVAIDYRWAGGHFDRLPALVADLVRRRIDVIAATSTAAAVAAKAATTTIPIVFETGGDPIQLGLVASLSHPGGNVTGVSQVSVAVVPKELELLHQLVPAAHVVAVLVNPTDPSLADTETREATSAARALGLELHVLYASAVAEFDAVFLKLTELRAGGLVICSDPLFTSRNDALVALANQHAVPIVYKGRDFAAAGGLLSYGSDLAELYRLTGVFTGRVLKGEKPADIPVQQASKLGLYVNLKTAKALGITIPQSILLRADEVIE